MDKKLSEALRTYFGPRYGIASAAARLEADLKALRERVEKLESLVHALAKDTGEMLRSWPPETRPAPERRHGWGCVDDGLLQTGPCKTSDPAPERETLCDHRYKDGGYCTITKAEHASRRDWSHKFVPPAPRKEEGECICLGNWRKIVAESEPLIGRSYVRDGHPYHFVGVLHGADDYYYVMIGVDGRASLLSCVSNIETHGWTLMPPRPEAQGEKNINECKGCGEPFCDCGKRAEAQGEWCRNGHPFVPSGDELICATCGASAVGPGKAQGEKCEHGYWKEYTCPKCPADWQRPAPSPGEKARDDGQHRCGPECEDGCTLGGIAEPPKEKARERRTVNLCVECGRWSTGDVAHDDDVTHDMTEERCVQVYVQQFPGETLAPFDEEWRKGYESGLRVGRASAPQQEGERVRECWLPGTGWNACDMPHCDYKQRTVLVLPEGSAAKGK